jgi:hypothetical protein
MSLKSEVLKSYKHLLRVRGKVFKNDLNLLEQSKKQIYSEYNFHKKVTNPKEVKELIEKAYQVGMFLEFELAQAVKNDNEETYSQNFYFLNFFKRYEIKR